MFSWRGDEEGCGLEEFIIVYWNMWEGADLTDEVYKAKNQIFFRAPFFQEACDFHVGYMLHVT